MDRGELFGQVGPVVGEFKVALGHAADRVGQLADGPQPAADEQRAVHYVGLTVILTDDTPMDIENIWFARCEVKEDGRLDQQAMLARVNARVDIQRRIATQGAVWPPGQDVIDARDLFKERRLQHETRWEPTEDDLVRLRELINTRAGWSLV